MAWLEDGSLITDAECGKLIAKGYQFVEGVLLPPDKVNKLIRSGYTRPHLAEELRYTFTEREAEDLKALGKGVLRLSVISLGVLGIGVFAKKKFDESKSETH